jgi:hypothetical protein
MMSGASEVVVSNRPCVARLTISWVGGLLLPGATPAQIALARGQAVNEAITSAADLD